MKIVKLDRRYKRYQDGYTHALRWHMYDHLSCMQYELALTALYGIHSYNLEKSLWYPEFGSRARNPYGSTRLPYFIYVKKESMITAVLLKVNLA